MLRPAPRPRRGALAAEAAVVYPVMIFLLLLLVVGGLGVFRYQQVAGLAREAARWASVRGGDYQKDTGQTSPTQDQIRQQAVLPLAAGMDPQNLSVQVQWVNGVTGQAVDWDASSKAPTTQTAGGDAVTNTVRVTVTYQWSPTVALIGPLNLKSVSEMPISF
jgi:Flp pilus assembly protein TadG